MSELDDLRAQVSAADRRIVELVNARLELVRKIKAHKLEHGIAFVDPERERAMVDDLLAHNDGVLSEEGLRRFYAELLALVKRELP